MKEGQKKVIFLTIFLGILIILAFSASAKIVYLDSAEVYNLGDKIDQKVAVTVSQDFDGFFRVVLKCSDNLDKLVYYSPLKLKADEEKNIELNFDFNSPGTCNFVSSLEKENDIQETVISDSFLISDRINVELTLNKQFFMPKDQLSFKGTAIRKNGQVFSGAAYFQIFDQNQSVIVNKGTFDFSLVVPENVQPGSHELRVEVSDDFNNRGEASVSFNVASIASSLIIEVNNETILPGTDLIMTPKLLDQYNNTLPENVSLRLNRIDSKILGFSQKTLLLEELLVSGDSSIFNFNNIAEPGDYIISVYSEGFNAEKIVNVPIVESVDIDINNGTIVATNIGNVPYKKPVQADLTFGNFSKTIILDLNLKVNETKTFNLQAPKGTYDIVVNLNNTVKKFTGIPLVGNLVAAINLGKEGQESNVTQKTSYLWVVVLVVVICVVYLFGRNFITLKKKPRAQGKSYSGYVSVSKKDKEDLESSVRSTAPAITSLRSSSSFKKPEEKPISKAVSKPSNEKIRTFATSVIPRDSSGARFVSSSSEDPVNKVFLRNAQRLEANSISESKLLGVDKKEASIAVVRINGMMLLENLKKRDSAAFERVLNDLFGYVVGVVGSHGGVASLHGSKILMFFPKSGEELNAIKTVSEINKFVERFNEKWKSEQVNISIGSGVHSGQVAFIMQSKELKYSSSDAVAIADALANKAFKTEILMSSNVYGKVASVVLSKKITPLHLGSGKAIETYMIQQSQQSNREDKSPVRKILDRMQ